MKWDTRKLEELGIVARGKSKHRPRNDPSLYGGKYPFVQTAEVKAANLYITEYKQTYNERGLHQSKLWDSGTLCITIAANIADTAILAFPACFPDSIIGFIPDGEIADTRYIKYCFDLMQQNFRQISQGATQDNLSLEKLATINFPIPPIDIQQKIADILSTFDDFIENNKRQIKLLDETAQRLYKEWFVNLRFPGYETTPVLDGVPEGWTIDTIDSRISLLSGYAFKSAEFNDEGIFKIVTIKNVKDGQFDNDNVNRIIQVPQKMPEHCKLEDGDILLSLTGNVGRVCLVHGSDFLLNQRVAKLKSDTPSYAYCLFRSKYMFDTMNNLANGAAQQNLSPIRTGKIRILFPSEELLKQFENTTQPMIARIMTLNKTITIVTQARDRLLPKLMSGIIEV